MIVITLTKVPPSLRGDLTKWYQEIQTGVYVGNVSAKIRDLLWERICQNIGSGEATMVFNARNELGYQFKTTRADYAVVDYDGIPLMMHLKEIPTPVKHGFSKAAKMHRARMMQHSSQITKQSGVKADFVVIDIETTGLDPAKDRILSIGAFKHQPKTSAESFEKFVLSDLPIPVKITRLTGISAEVILARGEQIEVVLGAFKKFVCELPILGYNVHFDEDFIQEAFEHSHQPELENSFIDLEPRIKRRQKFLDNYRLDTVLEKYEIVNRHPHDALNDAGATMELALKLMENGDLEI